MSKQAAALVARIRKKFPKPTAWGNSTTSAVAVRSRNEYCVGGAFISYINGNVPFPQLPRLADQLRTHNPSLGDPMPAGKLRTEIEGSMLHDGPYDKALEFAERIISANDSRHYDRAWKHLESALAYTEGGGKKKR